MIYSDGDDIIIIRLLGFRFKLVLCWLCWYYIGCVGITLVVLVLHWLRWYSIGSIGITLVVIPSLNVDGK